MWNYILGQGTEQFTNDKLSGVRLHIHNNISGADTCVARVRGVWSHKQPRKEDFGYR